MSQPEPAAETLEPVAISPPLKPGPGQTFRTVVTRLAAALTYRDFRVLWCGAFISSIGTWMQRVAQSWLVLTITGSAFFLGLDAFLGELPILLFTLIGGVFADRRDRRTLLISSQYVQMSSAFALAALVFWGRVEIWHILALSFLSGTAQAFGGPAYQSLLPSLVEKRHLPNAIALNSIQFNLARAIGPVIAGVALAAFGSAFAFTVNGLSFLVVIFALMSLRTRPVAFKPTHPMLHDLKSGLSYVKHETRISALVALAFAITFLSIPLVTLLPVFAQNVFEGGVERYSWMMASSGAGAVAGAMAVAWLGRFSRMGSVALIVFAVFGGLTLAFSASRWLWLSYGLLFFCGAALMVVLSLITSLVQLIAPEDMRGRVMSIYMLAFRGGMPLGSLTAGYLAASFSAPLAIGMTGLLMMVVAGGALRKRKVISYQ
jgi:predicted MFS family arabinose efflux permease